MQDNASGMNESNDNFFQANFDNMPLMDQYLDPNFGEKMSFERNDSLKPFCTYEASAFRSTPRSNKLNISPPSNLPSLGTPIEPIEAMKIASGFVPKIKKDSLVLNSPGTSMIEDMKNNINIITQTRCYAPNPIVISPVTPEFLQKNEYLPAQQPTVEHISLPESPSKKSRKSPESPNEEEPQGAMETDKKEKNRVSAQKCRMRKKQYVESLEAKIAELNDELAKCKEEIKTLKEAQSANLLAESSANEYQIKYKQLMTALENSLSTQQNDNVIHQVIGELNVFI